MAAKGREDINTPSSSTDEPSSDSSNGTNSSPNTPPSPAAQVFIQPQAPVTPPQPIARRPAPAYKRSPDKASPSKSRLGVIDEDSDAISPDVPGRNPLRKLGFSPLKFSLAPIPTLHAKRSTNDIYRDVEGPNGEKFSDLRRNRKSSEKRRFGWRLWACLAALLFIIVVALVVGLVVGLRNRSNQSNSSSDSSNSSVNSTFPAGQYSIASYLTTINTSCTTNAATWGCYPFTTYSQSSTASISIISWIITVQNSGSYLISSADRLFSYTFQNVPLRLNNNGTEDENWTFTTNFDKSYIPSTAITSDGTTAICYFSNTTLIGTLYTKKANSQALQNATWSSGNAATSNKPWPYALSFQETHNSLGGVPECFTFVNRQQGSRVNVLAGTSSGTSNCQCSYSNYI